jgi:O-antigen/teichoic acid export membrane protein
LSASTEAAGEPRPGYGRGAAILSVGIGVTGLVTYAYFSLASHTLSDSAYGGITLLWSAVFIVVSVLYRPVEQLLSRTIADRDARGQEGNEHLRVAATIQLGLAALFAVVALALHGPLKDGLFGGSSTLYWVMIAAVLWYAASYFARGFLAGHHRFGLYGLLVFLEAMSRVVFAVVAAVGIAEGQSVVALGIAAAPLFSLSVVPWAVRRRLRAGEPVPADDEPLPDDSTPEQAQFTLAHGAGFAGAVLLIMIAEQTFLNGGPLLVKATEGDSGTALAGFAFNVLLIARAPLQLFQAIQTSILPHLTKLSASGQTDPFRRTVRVTLTAIAAFAGVVALAMLALGPQIMRVAFGAGGGYGRGGLVLVAVGMGLYLAAATLNQAALAHGRTREAALCWVGSAIAFVVVLLIPGFDDRVLQVEIAYAGGALLLCGLLYVLYRRAAQGLAIGAD